MIKSRLKEANDSSVQVKIAVFLICKSVKSSVHSPLHFGNGFPVLFRL